MADIKVVTDEIAKMNLSEINQVLDAVAVRLDELEVKDPEARTLKQSTRAARSRVSKARLSKGSLSSGVREGIRQQRKQGAR